MFEKKTDEIKQKYVSVLHALNEYHLKVHKMEEENGKLVIHADAPNQEAKNEFWNAVKKVDPSYKDLSANINVVPQSAPAAAHANVIPVGGLAPGLSPSAPAEAAPKAAPAAADQTYTVKSGDTLSAIAKHFYGNGNEYMKIFNANRDQLKDPDKIHPGQVLKIPA